MNITDQINAIYELGKARKLKSEEGQIIPVALLQDSFDYLTSDEKEQFHNLKQQLPTFSELAQQAKQRLITRKRVRKNNVNRND